MLKRYSVFMMLLIVTASLVGISSIDQPAKVNTQPQTQQPQTQQTPQGAQILGRAQPPANTGIVTSQLQENAQLAERLFPFILQKLDGKTLVQKLDGPSVASLVQKMDGRQLADLLVQKMNGAQLAALLQKADARLLAEKIIPHIKVTLRMGDAYGPLVQVGKQGITTDTYHVSEARCPEGFRVTGGGGQISPGRAPPSSLFDFHAQDAADNNIAALMIIPPWRLQMMAKMEAHGNLLAYANCLAGEASVSLRPVGE